MSEHLQAFGDSARDLYAHLERESARALAQSRSEVNRRAAGAGRKIEFGETAPQPDAASLWRAMAGAGWLGLWVDEQRGGLGLGLAEALAIAESAGKHPRQPALLVAATQVALCLRASDTEGGKALLSQFIEGSLMAALAWQEQPGQVEPGQLERRQVDPGQAEPGKERHGHAGSGQRHPGRLEPKYAEPAKPGDSTPKAGRLTGRRLAVTPLSRADGWLVFDASGARLLWLPRGTSGVRLEAAETADGSDIGTLHFDDVDVAACTVIAEGAAVASLVSRANDNARIVQAGLLIGTADEVLRQTLEYLRTRVQFGRALGSFQALQHRCADNFASIQIARACLDDVLYELRDPDALPFQASRAKARCAEMALRVTRAAIHLHGAIGVTDELPISGFFRRALFLSGWLGNAAANRRRCLRVRPARQSSESKEKVSVPSNVPLDELDEPQFRETIRAFLAENFPANLRFLPRNAKWAEWKPWFQKLGKQGWAAPAWPKEYGGLGLGQDRLLALLEEQESFGVPRAPTESSVGMLGPLLIRHGTEEQQQRFLPGILSGETIWCQGYSEPNAGSDLASLRTSARLEGDKFIVNGQKIWTSMAAEATHMFALVRTQEGGAKQAGISFLLLSMDSPGLTVRTIRDMGGHDKFCEVFFDNVEVPAENLVGPLHGGWAVAKALLGFERVAIGSPSHSRVAMYQLESLGNARGLFEDAAFAQRFIELELDMLDVGAAYRHYSGYIRRGEDLPDHVPVLKIWATETLQNITAFMVEAANEDGMRLGVTEMGGDRVGTAGAHMTALYGFIYGGTNDIQRNIIARQVLRLPADR